METFHAIFGSPHSISAAQACARTVLVFAYGLILFRLAGRRTFARWSALDITVSIIVGSTLSRGLSGNAPLPTVFLEVALIMALHWIIARIIAHRRMFSRLIEGPAIELARDGKLFLSRLQQHSVSAADLDEALRSQGIENIDQASRVTLEPSGRISVLKSK
ncbi:DUF421 domain-containing protein [Stakelama sediminis]|uniref:Uncharacterized membrane protein YcaP (DUF421 family) n=1 Tax=Stakelama sediminis TaxID=463200 RepID=A0A840Z1L4_9SPHN|nr:YetF domain-containing protein [Stakelama sediminis]MBB5719667.1 uncharacterized membrane protein YcaP (DUF421 family) [Stakelama sediminis]